MNSFLKVLLVAALLIVTLVIPLGAYTRLSDSGLGCPDWPGCYGFIDFRKSMEYVNEINSDSPGALREAHKTWPEMVHRYFASGLGFIIMVLMLGVFLLKYQSQRDQSSVRSIINWGSLPLLLFILVCFQGVLGMWTVTMKLYPPTVVAHLYGGFLTFSLLCILLCRVFNFGPSQVDPELSKLRYLGVLSLFLLVVQIGLGGWMSANYAALVCTELPVCESGWLGKIVLAEAFSAPYEQGVDYEFGLLSHDARVTIHVLHRVLALLFSILALVFIALLLKGATAFTKKLTAVLLVLLVIQILLGLSNVVFSLPIYVATAHNGVGALLLASHLYLCYLAFGKGLKVKLKVK